MDERSIRQYISEHFEGTREFDASDNWFFFYGAEEMFPFATLMTNDINDQASDLDRPGVCRLNIGVSRVTFQSLFGDYKGDDEAAARYDFKALDRLMPHPVYARQHWVCIVNPSDETFESQVVPLLEEAYNRDVARQSRKGRGRERE